MMSSRRISANRASCATGTLFSKRYDWYSVPQLETDSVIGLEARVRRHDHVSIVRHCDVPGVENSVQVRCQQQRKHRASVVGKGSGDVRLRERCDEQGIRKRFGRV